MPITGLAVGIALGFIMQRGRFCVTNAFREVFTAKRTRWLTAFVLVIAIQSVGVFALASAGVITVGAKALPLAAVVVGSLLFGIAIVLAGGCATGTYYRAGEGLVGSWFALIAYAVSAAIMLNGPLKPLTASARQASVPVTSIHASLGVSPWLLVVALVAVTAWAVWRHLRGPRLVVAELPRLRKGLAYWLFEKPWHPFVTAALIGVIAIAAYPLSWASGRKGGLGITTPSGNAITYLTTGDPARLDWGVFLVLGLIAGSFIAAKAAGEFRLRAPDASTSVRAIIGGTGMGVGAALAGGCTIGNAMVASAQFSWQGWLAFALMFAGVGIGTKLFVTHPTRGRTPATLTPVAVSA